MRRPPPALTSLRNNLTTKAGLLAAALALAASPALADYANDCRNLGFSGAQMRRAAISGDLGQAGRYAGGIIVFTQMMKAEYGVPLDKILVNCLPTDNPAGAWKLLQETATMAGRPSPAPIIPPNSAHAYAYANAAGLVRSRRLGRL